MAPEKQDHTAENSTEPPSKSQLKREARALFELGRDLADMNTKALKTLPIEADLLREIEFARGIKAHVARKRHLQFVAKMMRSRDVTPIREALEARQMEARGLTVRHHRAESWRDRLISGGDSELAEFLAQASHTDAQLLRQLVRNAKREAEKNKPPASARKLFRMLRDMDAEQDLPPAP